MAVLLTPPFLQFFDADGNPLAGGKIYTYSAGTTTLKPTYTDSTGLIKLTNPIILDAAGRAVVWGQGSYRIDVYGSADNLIRSIDNITTFATLESSNDPYFETFSGTGSQTVFTTSMPLGNDSKSLQVFVNTPVQSYVDNGDFATDTAWTKGAGWTIAAGVATATGAISTAISQPSPKTITAGRAYRVTYTITRSAGGLIPSIGGNNGTERTASGTYNEIITAGSTQTVAFTGNAFTGTLDTVVIENIDSVGFQILNPNTYTISGTTLTFATAPASGTNNIYVAAPTSLVGAAVAAADQAIAAAAQADAAVVTVQNQKLVWQGDWAAGTYDINDAVQYQGSSWIVTAATTTDTPSLASPDWDLLASKGVDGTGGITSPTAAQIGALLRASAAGVYGWFNGSQTISSAATVNLVTATSPVVIVTGSTTITSFSTPTTSGDIRYVIFSGTMTLTHNATTLILPGAANITTATGDVAVFVSNGTLGWRCVSYSRYSGKPIVGPASADITDSTSTGRSVLTAATAADARTAIGVYDKIIGYATNTSINNDSTTTQIPFDNTKPQSTEGKEYLTVSIVPKASTSTINGTVSVNVGASSNNTLICVALFRDSLPDAIKSVFVRVVDSNDVTPVSFDFQDSPATTSTVTYKIRFGPTSAVTGYVNRNTSTSIGGGTIFSGLTVQEVRA